MRHAHPVRLLAASALLLAAGCGAEPTPATADGRGAPDTPDGTRAAQGIVKCPDPNSCTLSNGTGVYFAEKGSAGLDDDIHLLVTHFDNHEKDVTFEGRYYDFDNDVWQDLPTSGLVTTGIFGGDEWDVVALHEAGSAARVTLQSRKDGTQIVLSGKDLLELELRLRIENPMKRGKLSFYLLRFTAVDVDGNVDIYMPEWRPDAYGTQWKPYCLDPNGKPDNAVFQEGIQVDPVTGAVNYGGAADYSVTFSCRLGAPATCEVWGYESIKYAWQFRSCIHMKRASYCGDAGNYTISGTKLLVADSVPLWTDKIDNTTVEAKWSPKGAVCVTNPRHPGLGFNFFCGGFPVPKCPSPLVNNDPEFLISGNP